MIFLTKIVKLSKKDQFYKNENKTMNKLEISAIKFVILNYSFNQR